jgi:hypothetical protein
MGDVKAKNIEVSGKIVTGVDIEGAVSDAVLKAALDTAQRLQGSVTAEEKLKAGEIITGLRYFNPQKPDRESFVKDLKVLREQLAGLTADPNTPAIVDRAVKALDEAVAETGEKEPLASRIRNRLQETLEFITNAGKALDAASKAGPLIAQAIGTATVLYQAAQVLF